ncbi:site-specific DNA-methyltransferase [Pseudidiomarina salilacus]|uniref:site-specific DNA-methyltransferase n=1 Tax=Pseudidiomarina salilacus TaxID=3384452 RepID=UPI003984BA9D
MDKLKMHSPDMTQENIKKIQALFPNCVTEARDENGKLRLAIDFDQLKQELSDSIVEGPQERYHLNWPGKRKALISANRATTSTLRPSISESISFDTTKNLLIEGDNLESLKILQESYVGKVKMIYIDPPYNTGEDFIYNDDFSSDVASYRLDAEEVDANGNQLLRLSDTYGRFHSDWLSMMYPRLKLARNLLREDGQIFISIGDHEVHNLRKLCDEIFGAGNFEGQIHWRRRHNQPNDKTKMIGVVGEHILAYSKNKLFFKSVGVGKIELTGNFSNPDNDPRGDWASKPWKVGSDQNGSRYKITTPTGRVLDEEWMGEQSNYQRLLRDNRIYFPNNGDGFPRKKYFKFERESEGQCATNWWTSDLFGHNQEGNDILTGLMDGIKNTFSNPKPPKLIKNLMSISNCQSGDIVMDFFLGSASTFHAMLEYGRKLHFIGVQLPEVLSEKIKEHRPAIEFCQKNKLDTNLIEITKERMRRVGILYKDTEEDVGFRLLKLDSSNLNDIFYEVGNLKQSELNFSVENYRADRESIDILFQVLIDSGLDLRSEILIKRIDNMLCHIVDGGALITCFEGNVSDKLIREIAAFKPLRVVFRDSVFKLDSDKINTEQLLKQISPETECRSV